MFATVAYALPVSRPARFFRCDLQVQTPWDGEHWGGENTAELSDEGIAEQIVDAAYERDLDVIAITDHNFASRAGIPLIQQAARARVPAGRDALVVLPGFEISVSVGSGWHALAVFDEDADLEGIAHVLTLCGVDIRKRTDEGWEPARKPFSDIIEAIQGPNGPRGLVIPAHVTADDGIFDGDKIADWFQRDVFCDPRLLCIDLNRDPNGLSKGWRELFENGSACAPAWRRVRKVAISASSDARSFRKEPAGKRNPEAAWIGKRSTWIKMSTPCIEALRSAFLDPDDRLLHGAESPNTPSHPWISSLSIRGGSHVEDTSGLSLSPFLNVFIGGRGSGKSTLLAAAGCAATGSHSQKDRGQWSASGRLDAEWKQGEGSFSSVYDANAEEVPGSVPPGARVVQQGSIVDMGGSAGAFIEALDETCGAELSDRLRISGELETEGLRLQGVRVERQAVHAQLADAEQQSADIARQLASDRAAQEAAVKLRQQRVAATASETRGVVQAMAQGRLWQTAQEIGAHIDEVLESVARLPLDEDARRVAEEWLTVIRDTAAAELERSIRAFEGLTSATTSAPPELAELAGGAAVPAQGEANAAVSSTVDLENRGQLFAKKASELRQRIDGLDQQIATLFGDAFNPGLYRRLQTAWAHETAARAAAIPAQPITSSSGETLTLHLLPYGTPQLSANTFRDLVAHRGRFNDSDLEDVFRVAHDEATKQSGAFAPAALVAVWASADPARSAPLLLGQPLPIELASSTHLSPARLEAFREAFGSAEALHTLLTRRVQDALDATLTRDDGTLAGSILGGELSEGQRAAAVLSVLLLSEGPPLLLDQPEDDLDNRFIFSHLVGGIRGVKLRRQVIVVTHNPNIPVLGGAEQVIACEMSAGRAKLLPKGAIDRASCKAAIHEVLEGSEQAFKRRMDIYGF